MAEGTDKVTKELLSLEPSAMVELFIIIPDANNESTKDHVYIHNGSASGKPIYFQNKTYNSIAMEFEGFEAKTTARLSRPKLKVSNREYFASNLLQGVADDLRATEVIRIKTFVRFLDDSNFEGGENPFGPQPNGGDSVVNQRFIVSQKMTENKEYVEVELTTPIDVDSKNLNQRRVFAKYCPFEYRGNGCRYSGPLINQENGKPFTTSNGSIMDKRSDGSWTPFWNETTTYYTGNKVRLRNNRNKLYDDEYAYNYGDQNLWTYYVSRKTQSGNDPRDEEGKWENWQKDGCNKTLASCKLRFAGAKDLHFGGYPGTDSFQFRRGIS